MENKNNKKTLVIVLALVLLLGAAYAGYSFLSKGNSPDRLAQQGGSSSSVEEAEKVKAPGFMVYDKDGREVLFSDFEGKPVVLNFWASWCGPCKHEMPAFEEAYKEFGEDVHFVMVNATDGQRETAEKALSFIEEQGYTFPVYLDSDYDANMTYGIRGLPTTYFIDKDGYALAMAQSAIDGDILREGIDLILDK